MSNEMGNTFVYPIYYYEGSLKRTRPLDWTVKEPPAKRIRIVPFDENGAKAVKLPEPQYIAIRIN